MLGTSSQLKRTVIMLVLRREETHTHNYFLSSVPLCLASLIFDHDTYAELDVERNIGWKDSTTPSTWWLLWIWVSTLYRVTMGARGHRQRPLHGISSPPLSRSDSPERTGVWQRTDLLSAMAPLSPPRNQCMRLRGSGLEGTVWALGGIEGGCLRRGQMQSTWQDKWKSLSCFMWKLTLVGAAHCARGSIFSASLSPHKSNEQDFRFTLLLHRKGSLKMVTKILSKVTQSVPLSEMFQFSFAV